MAISRDVIWGFLQANRFKHGARSLEGIVRTSAINQGGYFGVSARPSRELLKLHVSDDFIAKVQHGGFV